jgi:drug/metabolite transporter (DMT)-like permease
MTRRDALVSLHAAALLFGFAGLFGKWLVLPAATIVLGRTLIAAVTLWALLRASREPLGPFEWRLAAGGAVLALHWVAFFEAIQTSSVAIGLLGFASFPVFALLLEAAILKHTLSRRDWMLALIVASGLALVTGIPSRQSCGARIAVGCALGICICAPRGRQPPARGAP